MVYSKGPEEREAGGEKGGALLRMLFEVTSKRNVEQSQIAIPSRLLEFPTQCLSRPGCTQHVLG